MLRFAVIAGAILFASAANHGYKSSRTWLPREPVSLQMHELTEDESVSDFSWRAQGLVTSDWNQHIPTYCGSCWIHGTLSAINDRIKIARNGAQPDIMISRQAVVNCVPDPDPKVTEAPGCNGGDPHMVHAYMHKTRMPDSSCLPYQAVNMKCIPENICRNCLPPSQGLGAEAAGCYAIDNFIGYGVSDFGTINGTAAMKREIKKNGPIACSFATDDEFMFNYSANTLANDGVFVSPTKKTADDIDHIMEIAGWGKSPSGIEYWEVRNSWGTYWGSGGWAKIKIGTVMAEYECGWSIPEFDQLKDVEAGKIMGDYRTGIHRVPIKGTKDVELVV